MYNKCYENISDAFQSDKLSVSSFFIQFAKKHKNNIFYFISKNIKVSKILKKTN